MVAVVVKVVSVTVMVVDPTASALTFPAESTAATAGCDEVKYGGCRDEVLVPSERCPVIVNLTWVPTSMVGLLGVASIDTRVGLLVVPPVLVPPPLLGAPPLVPPPQPAAVSTAAMSIQPRGPGMHLAKVFPYW